MGEQLGQLGAAEQDTAERVVANLQTGLHDIKPDGRSSAATALTAVGVAHSVLTVTVAEALASRFECAEASLHLVDDRRGPSQSVLLPERDRYSSAISE